MPIGPDDIRKPEDLDKPRPKGKLPYLPDDFSTDPLRNWLTIACRPLPGWRVWGFTRAGRGRNDPCSLILAGPAGERSEVRFNTQVGLRSQPRITLAAMTDSVLRLPPLSKTEVEDLWIALCGLGAVVEAQDERDEAREWVEEMVRVSEPLTGYSLVRETRHDALMALKDRGEFSRLHAQELLRRPDRDWPHRPTRLIDARTEEQWLRAGETAVYVRHIIGVNNLPTATLRARFDEIGVRATHFQDHRPPHPKAWLYRVADEFIETEGAG
jgi:hypothetical protein